MNEIDIGDVSARRAVDAPADATLLAITGPAASGKTETLARRYVELLARDATLTIDATIVTAADDAGAQALAARIHALLPPPRVAERGRGGRYFGCGLDRLAFDILADHATLTGLAYDLKEICAYDAEEIFERAIAPLFSADWNDFLGPDIDPEIPGLRAPDRFAVAVLRLIRKLRDAQMSPEAFLKAALRGATAFYSTPPNLSAPALLFATKDEHRGALAVDAGERERQRRRELDLAKIIEKLYRSYLNELVAHGALTAGDALAEATRFLEEHPATARAYRHRFRLAVVDDAHDLRTGEYRLLQAIFGKTLAGVTVAGDLNAATQTFAGARPERLLGPTATSFALQANYRVPAQLAATVRAILDPQTAVVLPAGNALRLFRAETLAEEAAATAAAVAACLAAGTPPGRIAVLHRSLRTLGAFEDALVDRDIPIALNGDAALFARHDTLDALAILWSTVDPFAHAWLLRVLQLPLLALSDATLAILCGEPANPQGRLFDLPTQEDSDGSRRWDRRRDLRLGTNVVRGDRDAELTPDARERLQSFRARRTRWQAALHAADAVSAARAILADAGIFAQLPGETLARSRRRGTIVNALIDTIATFTRRSPARNLADALAYCERITRSENGPAIDCADADAVVVAAIDSVKTRRFEHVFIVDVRAGSFPPYYVPDAFLFSTTYGMIPKDSVGEAVTSRTAKFTWYMHHAKLREAYAREDRRALAVALARADSSVTVSASGRATRGIAAPELLVELQALRPAPLPVARPVTAPARIVGAPAVTQPIVAAPPVTPGPAWAALERVAEMLRCVRCAPRSVIGAAVDGTFTLLSGRRPTHDQNVEARDVSVSYALGSTVVFGTIPALVRSGDVLYVAIARNDERTAELCIAAVATRVATDGFLVETADGIFTGPHPVAFDASLAHVRAVVDGSQRPLCAEHQ